MMLHRETMPFAPDGLQLNNQLQFNLNIPSNPENMTARFQHPGPIIVEKVGGKGGKSPTPKRDYRQTIKLTKASEEKLAWALQLARRDMKNMLHQQRTNVEENEKKKQNVKKKKGKLTRKTILNKSTKQTTTMPSNQNVYKKSVKTQTPPTKFVHFSGRGQLQNLPTNSTEKLIRWTSPIRLREPTGYNAKQREKTPPSKEKFSPDTRQAKEIRKLRNELRFYVERIEKLTKEAKLSASPQKDDDDEKDLLRREVKRAEQTSRSSRLLYSLQQQVRELQEDLWRTGPSKIKHAKRSQLLSRLAAAHRGAVRILQACLHQLPDQLSDEGTLPLLYQDLGQLISKLSHCTSKLELDENGIPDGIFNIFQKFQTPQRLVQSPAGSRLKAGLSPTQNSRRKLEFSKNLLSGRKVREKQTISPFLKESFPSKSLPRDSHFTPSFGTAQRLKADAAKQIATPGSPERNEAIKAGLEALMRIEEIDTIQRQVHRRPQGPVKRPKVRGRMGVILPSRLKVNREQVRKAKPVIGRAHYLQATQASKLKTQEHKKDANEKAQLDEKPPWVSSGSPRSFHKSPTERKQRQEEKEQDNEPVIPRTKRVLFEDEITDSDQMKRDSLETSGCYGDGRQLADNMIGHAEKLILERLQPLLRKADDIISKHEGLSHQTQPPSMQQKLSQRMTDKVTDHAGLLGDLLLEDILDDTAQEMERIERRDEAVRHAASMEDAPTYETMLQTLERMEAEEESIRRRWRKVAYYDSGTSCREHQEKENGDKQGMVMGTPLEGALLERLDDPPVEYTGIQFTTQPVHSGRCITITQPGLSDSQTSNSDIEPEPSQSIEEHLAKAQPAWAKPSQNFTLKLPSEMEKRIVQTRNTFEAHLNRKSHLTYGDFDPWKLVTEVSDDLVDGILQDVAEELADFSGGFMDALCKAEFDKGSATSQ